MGAEFDLAAFQATLLSPLLLHAAWTTLWVATAAQAIGTAIGLLLGPVLAWRLRPFEWIVGVYLWVFRGTPLLAQILFFYAALPQMGVRLGLIATGLLALGLNEGARMAEIVRSGLISVPREQREAAAALGLRPLPAFLLVVLPQAMRAIVPPLVSNYTYMIKATSLLSVIAFAELLRTAQLMAQSMARPLEVYSAVALVYLAIVTVVTLGQGALERRLSRATARPAPAPAAVLDTPAPAAPPAVAPPAAPALLEARGITKRHGGFVALQPTTLSIAQGEVVAVMGASGSGKSTLVRCLNWLDPPEEGVVLLAGKPVGAAPLQGGGRRALPGAEVAAMRARFGMVFQRFHLFGHLTAAENVALGPRKVLGLPRARAMEEARAQLARLGLAAEADRYPATLSGGQRQRVAIARALAMRPEVLLFDEPTSALDPESVQEVLSAIRMLAASGATMVVVTHEVGFARAAAHRVLFLAGGRVVEDAAAARFFAAPADPHARVFLAGHMQGTTP